MLGCIFVVRMASPELRGELSHRIRQLEHFYAALGWTCDIAPQSEDRIVVGRLGTPGAMSPLTASEQMTWGEPVGTVPALSSASDEELRRLDGTALVVEPHEREVLLATGSGVTVLYDCGGEGVHAWSTQAIAASWLARGEARLDAAVLPELLAVEFVGDTRTHIRDVRAVPSCQHITISPSSVTARSFWPSAERWAPVPEALAYEHAEQALLRHLDGRLAATPQPYCGLTGGYDSPVIAVAARELGHAIPCFTWGDETGPQDPAEIAATLGLSHERIPYEPLEQAESLLHVRKEALWNEGLAPAVAFGRPRWPEGITNFVTGGGGEIGRAFYYALSARNFRSPSQRNLARIMSFQDRLAGMAPESAALVRERTAAWVEDACSVRPGWAALDIIYADQRMRRWGRSFFPRDTAATAVFFTPEIARALASLPLEARITSGFHRRFLASREPSLLPPPIGAQRRGVPPVARRAVAAVRRRQARMHRLELPVDWGALVTIRDWYLAALEHPHVAEVGGAWVEETRAGFLAGDWSAAAKTFRVAGYAAVASQLDELERSTLSVASRGDAGSSLVPLP